MFKLEIETDNAAFDGDANLEAELSRILRSIAETIRRRGISDAGESVIVRDTNGNRCGSYGIQRRAREARKPFTTFGAESTAENPHGIRKSYTKA